MMEHIFSQSMKGKLQLNEIKKYNITKPEAYLNLTQKG
jgi:hypothetical protein